MGKEIARLAHRGGIFAGPENTMTAFRAAVSQGCEGIETDIRLTGDGKVVVAHDRGFSRVMCGSTCQETRQIREMTWKEIEKTPLPFAGHLLRYFPEEGFENEADYYLPWELDEPERIRKKAGEWLAESEALPGEERAEALFDHFHRQYWETWQRLAGCDGRTEHYVLLEEYLDWLGGQPAGLITEIEYKEPGMVEEVDRILRETKTADRCILFSGLDVCNEEIQNFYRSHRKPEGLRLGANLRFINEKTLPLLDQWDLYEVGLNADTFGAYETDLLHRKGILVFSNLGDYPSWWEKMDRLDTDGFKTNCLREYNAWRRAWQTAE